MSWTEDRVSILKKLWGDGHTAAEIAKRLGGVTRNAVIGKAHRLKLSNRVSPIQQNKSPANKNIERKKTAEKIRVSKPAPSKTVTVDKVKTTPASSENLFSLMDLKPRMCRWPSGDPKHEGFGFCGANTITGIPYCEEHAKLAYQAASRNRILDKNNKTSDKNAPTKEEKKVASGSGA